MDKCEFAKIWFIADTHFGHGNIIRYCNRPFTSTQEMNDTVLNNINEVVQPNHILYHLGDFAWFRGDNARAQIQAYRNQIKCKTVFLIAGNHDPHNSLDQPRPWLRDIFSNVYVHMKLKTTINNQPQHIILYHYAGRVWNSSVHGVWQLYGHSHNALVDDPNALSIDVGIDAAAARATGKTYAEIQQDPTVLDPAQYRPISLQEVHALMSQKQWTPPFPKDRQ